MSDQDKAEEKIKLKFCFKLGKSAKEAYSMLKEVYKGTCLTERTVFRWYVNFKSGREETKDSERTGRPTTVKTPENVEKVKQMILVDRRMSVRIIADKLEINKTVYEILTQNLQKKKKCSRIVPKILDDQKLAITVSQYLARNRVTVMPHPPYSPDLSPCDFFLFSRIKKHLKGHRYANHEEIIAATTAQLKSVQASEFASCFSNLVKKWRKGKQSEGDYFEGDF